MRYYIAYTTDGYTEDQRGKSCENCQMLGIYEAAHEEDAAEKCRLELIEWQQSFDDIFIRELVNDKVFNSHGIFDDDERLEPYED